MRRRVRSVNLGFVIWPMSESGHSRRFVGVRATSGYPPELTVKANRQLEPWRSIATPAHTRFQIREGRLSEVKQP
jgi:hypothetical protein